VKGRSLRHCQICGVTNEERPLRFYSNIDDTVWIYLCHDCETKVLVKTGGEIPLESLKNLGGDLFGREETDNRSDTKKLVNLCRKFSCVFELFG